MQRKVATVVVVATMLFAVIGMAAPARASCGAPAPYGQAIEEAPAVFVGRVVHLENERRWATVAVHEVWKGRNVAPTVEVRAGPKDPPGGLSTMTTVDRQYRSGRSYLFVPYRSNDGIFRDNACTRTTLYTQKLDRFRPAGAAAPSPHVDEPVPTDPSSDGGGRSILLWSSIPALLIVLGAVAFLVKRRRSGI